MSTDSPLARHIEERMREAVEGPEPDSFVFFNLPERTPEEKAIDALRATGAEHTGWPDAMPKPIQRNEWRFQLHVDTAVAIGLMEPPEGYVPWTPPPTPWRRRFRLAVRHRVYRLRISLASRLAGFDVEERD